MVILLYCDLVYDKDVCLGEVDFIVVKYCNGLMVMIMVVFQGYYLCFVDMVFGGDFY